MAVGGSVKTYRLPPMFWHDYTVRGLPEEGAARLVAAHATSAAVELDTAAFDDLMSDAVYYSDAHDIGSSGLTSSARATVLALNRQGRP